MALIFSPPGRFVGESPLGDAQISFSEVISGNLNEVADDTFLGYRRHSTFELGNHLDPDGWFGMVRRELDQHPLYRRPIKGLAASGRRTWYAPDVVLGPVAAAASR